MTSFPRLLGVLLSIGLTVPGNRLLAEGAPDPPAGLAPVAVSLPKAPEFQLNTNEDENARDSEERYHWKGLLLQSLEFNAIENGFRIASDDQIRGMLANKSYWHDYAASLRQFNMRRWNDGDSFLVNYVGHPLQGAVSGYLAIQNDPDGRTLEFSNSREYWKSRGKAFLWSTVFSTQSEIGPLGEAAIGNEGGWTYPRLACHKPCPQFRPGIDPYTNNTGWVDFIITPVVGTLWVVAEDILDRYVSDPFQGDEYYRGYPKILRASLSPARSFANVMRGEKPWYRDWQHKGTPWFAMGRIRVLPSDDQFEEYERRPRMEISPHPVFLSMAVNTANCRNCRRTLTGGGIEASYRLNRWLDADMELNRFGDASPLPSDRAGGDLLNAFFGLRAGFDTPNYGLKLVVRPGFFQFNNADLTSDAAVQDGDVAAETPETCTITHFAWNLALSGDYRIGRNFALRGTVGETLVRYRTAEEDPPGIGTPPYLSWLSHDNYINRGNWTVEVGPVFRFGNSHGE